MAWHRTGGKPVHEPLMAQFISNELNKGEANVVEL